MPSFSQSKAKSWNLKHRTLCTVLRFVNKVRFSAAAALPRGSAHEIAFAAQMHENRGRVPRFSYFQREKVSAWELSDVRVLQSQNTDCRKNEVFRQSQHRTLCTVLFICRRNFAHGRAVLQRKYTSNCRKMRKRANKTYNLQGNVL